MKYIEKKGEVGLETDMGTRAVGAQFAARLVSDWDFDIEAPNRYSKRFVRGKPPKLVHNIIFSMPPGTSAGKFLGAVRGGHPQDLCKQRRFAQNFEEAFGVKRR